MSDNTVELFHGDCREVMKELPENSVDSIVISKAEQMEDRTTPTTQMELPL